MKKLFLILFTSCLSAQTVVSLKVLTTSQTQALIQAITTTAGNPFVGTCSVQASTGLTYASPGIDDVNPSIFSGSNLDSRDGATVKGSVRTFTLGTRGSAFKGSDGQFHSRTLQTDQDYNFAMTCGATTNTITLHTRLPAWGATYPEAPRWDNTAYGNRAYPDVDWTDRSKTYVDGLSGILYKRMTSPKDYPYNVVSHALFTIAIDNSSGGWTNPANILANQSTGTFASTSTANATIFVPIPPGTLSSGNTSMDPYPYPNDVMVRSFCKGSGGAVLEMAYTVDSTTPATAWNPVVCHAGSFAETDFPSTYPGQAFSDWGPIVPLPKNLLQNVTAFGATYTGHTVTWLSGPVKFVSYRAHGSKVFLAGSGCNGVDICTVDVWNNPNSFTVQESLPTSAGGLADLGPGVLIRMQNTGASPSVQLNVTFDTSNTNQYAPSVNSATFVCNPNLGVSNINTDGAGNPISPAQSGRMCTLGTGFGAQVGLLIPQTGEWRPMSIFGNGTTNLIEFGGYNNFSNTDALTFYAQDNTSHIWRAVFNGTPGTYLAYQATLAAPAANSQFTWTDITAANTPIANQLTALGTSTPAGVQWNSGLYGTPNLVGVINGYALYQVQIAGGNPPDSPMIFVRADPSNNQIIDAYPTVGGTYPMRNVGAHEGAVELATFERTGGNPLQLYGQAALGGPFRYTGTSGITGLYHAGTATFSSQPSTAISSCTAANPVVCTSTASGLDWVFNTHVGTGPTQGATITTSGGSGSWTGGVSVNGTFIAQVSNAAPNTFTLVGVNGTGFGGTAPTSFTANQPIPLLKTASISNATPAVVTFTASQIFGATPPVTNPFKDGDPVVFTSGSSVDKTGPVDNISYFVKVTGLSTNQFSLYTDKALTAPVNGSTLPIDGFGDKLLAVFQWNSGDPSLIYFAGDCGTADFPVSGSLTLPLAFDSGPTGRRCMRIQVAGPACSQDIYTSTAATEKAQFPCGTNANYSSLGTPSLGDVISNVGLDGQGHESFVIVSKNTATDWTLMRWSFNQLPASNNYFGDYHKTGDGWYNYLLGWTPIVWPSIGYCWFNIGSSACTAENPLFASVHAATGPGSDFNFTTFVSGASPPRQGIDSITQVSPPQAVFGANPLTQTQAQDPQWTASTAFMSYGLSQTYPSANQLSGTPRIVESGWKGDTWGYLPPFPGTNYATPMTVVLVGGKAQTYKITAMPTTMDRKNSPTYGYSGPYTWLDISGPSASLGDTNTDGWKYCVVEFGGETCGQSGVSVGDVYVNLPIYVDPGNNSCQGSQFDLPSPCFFSLNGGSGWAVQAQINPIDTAGYSFRKLTQMGGPVMPYSFASWLQTPFISGVTQNWGIFYWQFLNGGPTTVMSMLLPPINGATKEGKDSVNRHAYQSYTHKYIVPSGVSATYARDVFGYMENGASTAGFCTSRQEACTNEPSSGPFSYRSDTATHIACSTSCSLTIPTIPGRTLYFVTEVLDGGGSVIYTSPQTAVLPVP